MKYVICLAEYLAKSKIESIKRNTFFKLGQKMYKFGGRKKISWILNVEIKTLAKHLELLCPKEI